MAPTPLPTPVTISSDGFPTAAIVVLAIGGYMVVFVTILAIRKCIVSKNGACCPPWCAEACACPGCCGSSNDPGCLVNCAQACDCKVPHKQQFMDMICPTKEWCDRTFCCCMSAQPGGECLKCSSCNDCCKDCGCPDFQCPVLQCPVMMDECNQAWDDFSRCLRECCLNMMTDSRTKLVRIDDPERPLRQYHEDDAYFAKDENRQHSQQSTPRSQGYYDRSHPVSYDGRSFLLPDARSNPAMYLGRHHQQRGFYSAEYDVHPPGSATMDETQFSSANSNDIRQSVIRQPILTTHDSARYNHRQFSQKYKPRNVSFRNDVAEEEYPTS